MCGGSVYRRAPRDRRPRLVVFVRTLLVLFAVSVASCAPSDPAPVEPESVEPLTAVEAARLFQRRCASCHGAQGRGDGPSAALVSPADLTSPVLQERLTDDGIARLLAEGQGAMPPFASLTSAEVDGLIRHVRSLRRADDNEGSR